MKRVSTLFLVFLIVSLVFSFPIFHALPVKANPTYEDFTTWTPVEPDSIFTITSSRVTCEDLDRDVEAYVYDDKGVDYFGDFEFWENIKGETTSSNAAYMGAIVISNDINDSNNIDNGLILWITSSSDTTKFVIQEVDGDYSTSDSLTEGVVYSIKLTRSGTTYRLDVYSTPELRIAGGDGDEWYTSITVATTTYRYIFVCSSRNTGNPDYNFDGYVENLDLEPEADETAPEWQNPFPSNGTIVVEDGAITIGAQGNDTVGLDYAWTSTNETGSWGNYSDCGFDTLHINYTIWNSSASGALCTMNINGQERIVFAYLNTTTHGGMGVGKFKYTDDRGQTISDDVLTIFNDVLPSSPVSVIQDGLYNIDNETLIAFVVYGGYNLRVCEINTTSWTYQNKTSLTNVRFYSSVIDRDKQAIYGVYLTTPVPRVDYWGYYNYSTDTFYTDAVIANTTQISGYSPNEACMYRFANGTWVAIIRYDGASLKYAWAVIASDGSESDWKGQISWNSGTGLPYYGAPRGLVNFNDTYTFLLNYYKTSATNLTTRIMKLDAHNPNTLIDYWEHGAGEEYSEGANGGLRRGVDNDGRVSLYCVADYGNTSESKIGVFFAWVLTDLSVEGTHSYQVPMDMNDVADTWAWSNFTWTNSSIDAGTRIDWRIWYNDTSGNVNATAIRYFLVGAGEYDPVDNNTSDADSSADKGTHSDFTNEQDCHNSEYDTLVENSTGGGSGDDYLFVDGFNSVNEEWDETGDSPWLDNSTANLISTNVDEEWHEEFAFADHGGSESITSVYLYIEINGPSARNDYVVIDVYNGSWANIANQDPDGDAYLWYNYDVGSTLDSWTKINAAKLRVQYQKSGSPSTQTIYVRRSYLKASYDSPANYRLDLEVQWTDANYTRTNEELCIYAGTFNTSENIQIQVWHSSTWNWLMNLTASQWNNISVSSYLDSSTFTIRYLDGTNTSDTECSAWNIDCTLLHTWEAGGEQNFYGLVGQQGNVSHSKSASFGLLTVIAQQVALLSNVVSSALKEFFGIITHIISSLFSKTSGFNKLGTLNSVFAATSDKSWNFALNPTVNPIFAVIGMYSSGAFTNLYGVIAEAFTASSQVAWSFARQTTLAQVFAVISSPEFIEVGFLDFFGSILQAITTTSQKTVQFTIFNEVTGVFTVATSVLAGVYKNFFGTVAQAISVASETAWSITISKTVSQQLTVALQRALGYDMQSLINQVLTVASTFDYIQTRNIFGAITQVVSISTQSSWVFNWFATANPTFTLESLVSAFQPGVINFYGRITQLLQAIGYTPLAPAQLELSFVLAAFAIVLAIIALALILTRGTPKQENRNISLGF